MEAYYADELAVLFPFYHIAYWMGLVSGRPGATWPNFTWTDPFAEGPSASIYEHWGKGDSEVGPEPNNSEPPQDCGLANYSQSYDAVWGWADAFCKEPHVFMCKMRGGWRAGHRAGCCCMPSQAKN